MTLDKRINKLEDSLGRPIKDAERSRCIAALLRAGARRSRMALSPGGKALLAELETADGFSQLSAGVQSALMALTEEVSRDLKSTP